MTDFLLELRSEEIPARMQKQAREDLARLFAAELAEAGLEAEAIETFSTPRRLALIARGLPRETQAVSEERRGPRADAPDRAIEGFLGSVGMTRDQVEEREEKKGTFLYAVIDNPGRETRAVLAEAIPNIVRDFPWPKSMRWGAASQDAGSLRWVRPLQGIVAILGDELVECAIGGISSGYDTVGHRFHHPGMITIGGAGDYAEKLRACHVVVDQKEREGIIRERADALAREAGLARVQDTGLVEENAGLTEWPVPLLGGFDPAFLDVAPEAITLAMRTHQKYFACVNPPRNGEGDHAKRGGGAPAASRDLADSTNPPVPLHQPSAGPPPPLGEDRLAPNFICVANIEAEDGGEAITRGNERVLAARLADAKFFWEQDLATPLADQAKKLDQIVFHEKLGTVADKVERVARLARWLVEEGIVQPSPLQGRGKSREAAKGEGESIPSGDADHGGASPLSPTLSPEGEREQLADKAEQAARLAKADLVTGTVGEFPELQGIVGGYLAEAQGLDPEIAAAIRDHYKPVGQGDEVPTAPVTVAVSLADKLDTLFHFFLIEERPSGSKDPYALRRAALGVIGMSRQNNLRWHIMLVGLTSLFGTVWERDRSEKHAPLIAAADALTELVDRDTGEHFLKGIAAAVTKLPDPRKLNLDVLMEVLRASAGVRDFFLDRLEVAVRESGVRPDLIQASAIIDGAKGKEDDLVRLLARVRALQDFLKTADGANLLAGYKRAANILKKEGRPSPLQGRGKSREAAKGEGESSSADETAEGEDSPLSPALSPEGEKGPAYEPQPEESILREALDVAEREADAAIAAEDFEGAMAALAGLRKPIDAFFDHVTVNDKDPVKREARLHMLERMRDAVHRVADFSKIEG